MSDWYSEWFIASNGQHVRLIIQRTGWFGFDIETPEGGDIAIAVVIDSYMNNIAIFSIDGLFIYWGYIDNIDGSPGILVKGDRRGNVGSRFEMAFESIKEFKKSLSEL